MGLWHCLPMVGTAYSYARKNADNPAYTFGTGKVNVLGGFASAVALAVVALMMLVESLQRLTDPQRRKGVGSHFDLSFFAIPVFYFIPVYIVPVQLKSE